MELYISHPHLEGAKQAVAECNVSLSEIAESKDHPALLLGLKRVLDAIDDGIVGGLGQKQLRETEEINKVVSPSQQDQLLSYPIARILVSAVGDDELIQRYISAEAKRSVENNIIPKREYRESYSLEDTIEYYNIDAKQRDTDTYRVAVEDYLRLAPVKQRQWSLRRKSPQGGEVVLSSTELEQIILTAVKEELGEGLPVSVPTSVAEGVEAQVEIIKKKINQTTVSTQDVPAVPDYFPHPFDKLYEEAQSDQVMEPVERTALVSFLSALGGTADEILSLFGTGENSLIESHITSVAESVISPPSMIALSESGVANIETRKKENPVQMYYDRIADEEIDKSDSLFT